MSVALGHMFLKLGDMFRFLDICSMKFVYMFHKSIFLFITAWYIVFYGSDGARAVRNRASFIFKG